MTNIPTLTHTTDREELPYSPDFVTRQMSKPKMCVGDSTIEKGFALAAARSLASWWNEHAGTLEIQSIGDKK